MNKSTPRDVFFYLLAMATLYFSAFNFVNLVFAHINAAFPDPLNQYYDPAGSMRWAIAALVIIFPVYLWVTRFLDRDIAKNHEKAEIKIRKWLVYLTLFIAALFIIGDLVALVFNFLKGDLTTQFVLEILTVLAVAGAVFGYYLSDLRKKPGTTTPRTRILSWAVIVAVAVAVIAGFFVAGSPFKQRLVRFDSQKASDLSQIQWQIVNYWQQKARLPNVLTDLEDSISGFKVPMDPQTSEAYTYQVKGPHAFALCANFNLASEENQTGLPRTAPLGKDVSDNWSHPTGTYCFDRTIDPELYPPIPKAKS